MNGIYASSIFDFSRTVSKMLFDKISPMVEYQDVDLSCGLVFSVKSRTAIDVVIFNHVAVMFPISLSSLSSLLSSKPPSDDEHL